MAEQGGQVQSANLDEILVKGEDGKFYILRGDELVPVEDGNTPKTDDPALDVYAARAGAVSAAPSPTDVIAGVLGAAAINFPDPQLRSRAEKAITLFFKDLRNQLETKETLMRSPKVGGVGLTEKDADTLLREADEQRKRWMDRFGNKETKKIEKAVVPSPARPPVIPAQQATRPVAVQKPVEKPKEVQPVALAAQVKPREVAPPVNLPTPSFAGASEGRPQSTSITPAIAKPVVPKSTIVIPVVPPTPAQPKVIVTPKPTGAPVVQETRKASSPIPQSKPAGRPIVADVTAPVQRAVGPIDELRYDLPSFRRLGSGNEGTKKIFDKIVFLLKQSWSDGMAALDAWRHAPVMQLVMAASRQSIATNKPVADVITETIRSGQPMVTIEEWKECMQLLQKLDKLVEAR